MKKKLLTRRKLWYELEKCLLIPQRQAVSIVNLIFTTIEDGLARGLECQFNGFGTFTVTHWKARSRPPQMLNGRKVTGELRESVRIRFSASELLKSRVKGAFRAGEFTPIHVQPKQMDKIAKLDAERREKRGLPISPGGS